ncbi:MAG TPA: PilZ domain-containing protein [bacterium]|nr:PilZ domain-containing protein [bacterium]
MTINVEKRKHNRFEFQKPVRVFPVLPSKSGNIYEVQTESFEVQARDISEGGLRLQSQQELNPQFLVKLNFEISKDQPVEVFGKIMWSQERHHGIRFMLVDQEMRKGIKSLARKKA